MNVSGSHRAKMNFVAVQHSCTSTSLQEDELSEASQAVCDSEVAMVAVLC